MELTRKELYDLVWSEPMTTIYVNVLVFQIMV